MSPQPGIGAKVTPHSGHVGKAALEDAGHWLIAADRSHQPARLGDHADARAHVAALVTAPPVICVGCDALAG